MKKEPMAIDKKALAIIGWTVVLATLLEGVNLIQDYLKKNGRKTK